MPRWRSHALLPGQSSFACWITRVGWRGKCCNLQSTRGAVSYPFLGRGKRMGVLGAAGVSKFVSWGSKAPFSLRRCLTEKKLLVGKCDKKPSSLRYPDSLVAWEVRFLMLPGVPGMFWWPAAWGCFHLLWMWKEHYISSLWCSWAAWHQIQKPGKNLAFPDLFPGLVLVTKKMVIGGWFYGFWGNPNNARLTEYRIYSDNWPR